MKVGTNAALQFFLIALVLFPVISVFYFAFSPSENIWPHLLSTTLPYYFSNTIYLLVGVAFGTLFIGVSTAYLTVHFRFPFREYLDFLLLLPLAFPAYITSYIYADLFEYAGPVQIAVRNLGNWSSSADYWFPDIRSIGGAIMIMSLTLYPYVYFLARTSFIQQTESLRDVGRLMGRGEWSIFLNISVPIARPAIFVGLSLALMETLSDFGTVQYLAVSTLTTGLYDVWQNMNNLGGGSQIAIVLFLFVIVFYAVEQLSQRKKRFYETDSTPREKHLINTSPAKQAAIFIFCSMPVVFGFLLPFILLSQKTFFYFDATEVKLLLKDAINSFTVATLVAIICSLLALLCLYSMRQSRQNQEKIFPKIIALGYALPGAVIAIGVMIPLAYFDNWLDSMLREYFSISSGLLLSGSIFALIIALTIRFLAISSGTLTAGFSKISDSFDMATKSLGYNQYKAFFPFYFPLIKKSFFTALLLVFIDTMKELPATLLLRPLNFDTLATRVYFYASEEMLEKGAASALIIVIFSIIPVIVLSYTIRK